MISMPAARGDGAYEHPAVAAAELLAPGAGPLVCGPIPIGLGHWLVRLSSRARPLRSGAGYTLTQLTKIRVRTLGDVMNSSLVALVRGAMPAAIEKGHRMRNPVAHPAIACARPAPWAPRPLPSRRQVVDLARGAGRSMPNEKGHGRRDARGRDAVPRLPAWGGRQGGRYLICSSAAVMPRTRTRHEARRRAGRRQDEQKPEQTSWPPAF